MPKKSLASLELAAIMNELQFLIKGRISQIYHPQKKELLLQLHAPNQGKQLLKIIPGKFLCLTKKKETSLRPSGFCMQLRKYVNNAFIRELYQKDAERIVVFELEKQEKYYLIIELFSKGNLILTDQNWQIITSLERQIWKDRTVKPKEKYIFPKLGVNWKTLMEKELSQILKKSEKKNLAVSLAVEIGLGGLYAEEVCRVSEIDKSILPKEADPQKILPTIKELIKKIEHPQGYIYEEQITPFPLEEKESRRTKTYNEAIDTLNPSQIVSPHEKKIKVMEKIISQQETSVKQLREKIEKNKKKGELIYEKYTPIQELLEIVKELKKTKDWKEIGKELKKEKKIKAVDLKKKTVIVDL